MSNTPIRISPSQIATWCGCHYSWYLQYVEKRRRPTMGTIPRYGIILHNLIANAVLCQMEGAEFIPARVDTYIESILAAAAAAGEELTEEAAKKQLEIVLTHVDIFRAAYLPKLRPAGVEEAWEWALEDDRVACVVYVRGDLRDERGIWVDHKLKSKIPSSVDSIPAADQLELQIQAAACPHTHDAIAHVYAKYGRKQHAIRLGLCGMEGARYPSAEALRDDTARICCGVAAGIAAGDDAPTGLWTERWGRQVCYYCDWRKTGACKYQGGQ